MILARLEQLFDKRPQLVCRYIVDAPIKVQVIFGSHALIQSRKFEQRSNAGTNFIRPHARIEAKHATLAHELLAVGAGPKHHVRDKHPRPL